MILVIFKIVYNYLKFLRNKIDGGKSINYCFENIFVKNFFTIPVSQRLCSG